MSLSLKHLRRIKKKKNQLVSCRTVHTCNHTHVYSHTYVQTDVHRTPAPGNLSSIGLAKKFVQVKEKLEQSEVKLLSCVRLFATPWTVAYQAPPSMGVFQARILEWAAIPSPGDLPNPGTFGQLNTFKILLLPLLDMTVINV